MNKCELYIPDKKKNDLVILIISLNYTSGWLS